MMKNFENCRLRIISSTLLVFYIGFYSSITFFYHTHLVDGKIVSHSHPFRQSTENRTNESGHTHTSNGFLLIHQLNQSEWDTTVAFLEIPVPIQFKISELFKKEDNKWLSQGIVFTPLRAPPRL